MTRYNINIDISDGMDDYIDTIVVISAFGYIYQKHKIRKSLDYMGIARRKIYENAISEINHVFRPL